MKNNRHGIPIVILKDVKSLIGNCKLCQRHVNMSPHIASSERSEQSVQISDSLRKTLHLSGSAVFHGRTVLSDFLPVRLCRSARTSRNFDTPGQKWYYIIIYRYPMPDILWPFYCWWKRSSFDALSVSRRCAEPSDQSSGALG